MVTWENYEEYMMLEADGELDAAGRQALQAFINANPSAQEEQASFYAVKLQHDDTIVYPGKQALLKKERKAAVIFFRPLTITAAAAAIGAIILIKALWPDNTRKHDLQMAALPLVKQEALPVPMRDTSFKRSVAIASITKAFAVHVPSVNSSHSTAAVNRQERSSDSFTPLPIASSQSINHAVVPAIAPQAAQQESIVRVEQAPGQHTESALPHIHLAAQNQPAVNLIRQALAARVAQASNAAKTIKETSLTIKLGKGSVNINL
jgi:hypothetical protein